MNCQAFSLVWRNNICYLYCNWSTKANSKNKKDSKVKKTLIFPSTNHNSSDISESHKSDKTGQILRQFEKKGSYLRQSKKAQSLNNLATRISAIAIIKDKK